MSGVFDNAAVQVPCPKCGHKTNKTIGWLRANREFVCQCGVTIVLQSDQFRSEMAKADAAFDDFKRTLRNLGR